MKTLTQMKVKKMITKQIPALALAFFVAIQMVPAWSGGGGGEANAAGPQPMGIPTVVAVEGVPRLVPRSGLEEDVILDQKIPMHGVVVTGPEQKLAISVASKAGTPLEEQDLVFLSYGSRMRTTPGGMSEAGGVGLRFELLHGTARVIVREPTGMSRAWIALPDGRRIDFDKADAVVTVDGDKVELAVGAGTATLTMGQRRIRVREGMSRSIQGENVMAARKHESDAWAAIAGAAGIATVDATQPTFSDAARGASSTAAAAPVVTPATQPAQGGEEPAATAEGDYVYAEMVTNKGRVVLELDRGLAPISVANFISYVEEGYYDGTIFHRVMDNFMIQGGGFTQDMQKKPTKDGIKNEWANGLKNVRGSLAMARVGGNADSGTSQFYINVVNNAALDRPSARDGAAYAVFGRVAKGMEVVDAIRKTAVARQSGHANVPVVPVIIESVEMTTREAALE